MPAAARGRAAGKSAKVWREALQRALNKRVNPADEESPRRLEAIAEAVVDAAMQGDMQAIREIGERIDGKAAQQLVHVGDEDGGPVNMVHTIERKIVDPTD